MVFFKDQVASGKLLGPQLHRHCSAAAAATGPLWIKHETVTRHKNHQKYLFSKVNTFFYPLNPTILCFKKLVESQAADETLTIHFSSLFSSWKNMKQNNSWATRDVCWKAGGQPDGFLFRFQHVSFLFICVAPSVMWPIYIWLYDFTWDAKVCFGIWTILTVLLRDPQFGSKIKQRHWFTVPRKIRSRSTRTDDQFLPAPGTGPVFPPFLGLAYSPSGFQPQPQPQCQGATVEHIRAICQFFSNKNDSDVFEL